MNSLTPEKELEILETLRAKVSSVESAINVVTDEPLLDSKNDVLKTICYKTANNKTEIRYIKIDFLGYTDDPENGCEDDPVVYLNYNFHLFHQYIEKRSDGSSSAKDIKKLVFNLRNAFLPFKNGERKIAEIYESTPLTQARFIILGEDPMTGGHYGHFTDLICKVEIS